MTTADSIDHAILQNVFHPSDFSPASERAFAHALKAALTAKAGLTILHVSQQRETEWMEFPGVRETLERWRLLPKNSQRSDVSKLGIDVKKVKTSKLSEYSPKPAKRTCCGSGMTFGWA